MSTDMLIIWGSISSFCMFLIMQMVVFRQLPPEKVFSGIISIFLAAGLLNSLLLMYPVKENMLLIFLLTWIIYGLLAFLYIVGVFGVIESSIRIRLLSLIAQSSGGLRYTQFLKKYNRDMVINKRLKRLVGSGELVVINGKYQLGKKFSFFHLPAYLSQVLKKLYGVK